MTTVRSVDPHDDAAFRAWYDALAAGIEADRTDPTGWTYPEITVAYRHPDPSIRRTPFAAYDDDGRCVGAAFASLPQKENLQRANLNVGVPPEHRRKGIGSALLAALIEHGLADGRTTMLAGVDVPVDVEDWPGVAFATKHGFSLALMEVRRQQPLPAPAERLDALAAKADERSGDYKIVSWNGACPDEYAEQYAHLKALLDTEAPTGDVHWDVPDWDVQRLRDEEEVATLQGRTLFSTIAIAPDGTVAAHTQAAVTKHDPTRAYQWDTLVLAEHRGHRLGLAVKIANVRALQTAHPDVTRMDTWNAEVNGPMVAVNEELGYRIVEYSHEYQRNLA
ncbi:GNAT family N-acetyltransferase [Tenggerimyces flavus]|uniref:GNAT family N-acetyltransferase n=1 Tax=Tenggerimyces flavus TaxID=1708749 RepID=A0ABV7YAF9_9ACTN|nr:GNAT family N-acetyltransferase [Tenggerimyces flavus]MBM7785901.1 GNAT superfamily N-acetyltransferase [Tenggerimyces flavus]